MIDYGHSNVTVGMRARIWQRRHLSSLLRFGETAENSLIDKLVPFEGKISSLSLPQQIHHCHYVFVKPEQQIENPSLVYSSNDCARIIGIQKEDVKTDLFVSAFVGNILLPGLDRPYATLYGCHSYGTWFGQLGDTSPYLFYSPS
jgi:hypothetical protein